MKISYEEVKTISEFVDVIRIRVEVFIIEQSCPPGWEPDELDKTAIHYVAIIDNKIVATARLCENSTTVAKIERMAVKKNYRSKGIGFGLIKYILFQAEQRGYKKVSAVVQAHAQKMYEKAGFKAISREHDIYNLGILHIDMEYTVR